MERTLHLISAGAAKGVVLALAEGFRREHGATMAGTFGAVGAMREQLLAGAPCDAIILTQALLEALAEEGRVRRETIAPIGLVYTGIAVRSGDRLPDIASEEALRASLRCATSVYLPDPVRATAGIQFMSVLDRLGIRGELESRLRAFPNGATAMAELARAGDANPIGCTQVTEILYTSGVTLVGKLPRAFELATLYAAAVCGVATEPELARAFVTMLGGPAAHDVRVAGGFDG